MASQKKWKRKSYVHSYLANENSELTTTYVPDTKIILKEFDPAYFGTPFILNYFAVYLQLTDRFVANAATGDVITLFVEEQTPDGAWERSAAFEGTASYTLAATPGFGSVLWLRNFHSTRKLRVSVAVDAAPAAATIVLGYDFVVTHESA